jgi:glycosyltransferase involved in cell wall biosynthesis
MKISIITICLNSEKTIVSTLNSLRNQSYKKIEHIIIDGGSTDKTISLIKKNKLKKSIFFIKKKSKIYEALNVGIEKATGKWILILHSNDVLNDPYIIKNIIPKLKNESQIYYGDVVYYSQQNHKKIVRNYSYPKYKNSKINLGLIPPHTGCFISKKNYKIIGKYDESYKIAGDFDFFARAIKNYNIKFKYINFIISRMQTGGLSGLNLKSYITSTREILKSLRNNKIKSNLFLVLSRIPAKMFQFFFLKVKKNNYQFSFQSINNPRNNHLPYLNLVKKIKNIDLNKNFILSALNLAFLGSFVKKEIIYDKNLVLWPDGIFSKSIASNIKKIPGRELLKKIILPNTIKKIFVLGTLSPSGESFLKNFYKKKIINKVLPYGNKENILKALKNFKIKKDCLIFITLPTPKQEQIALELAKKNKHFKIICIGGSIGMVSGSEKIVPEIFSNFEFLWRLRYETHRRALRLLSTFYYYIQGRYLGNDIKNIRIDVYNPKK